MDINGFKSSNIFEQYNCWVESLIAEDYYSPDTFDDEGNLLSEEYFREVDFEQAEDRILEVSHYIYREMANCRIFDSYPAGSIAYGEDAPASVVIRLLDEHKDFSHVALLGTIYFLLVYDYPNYSAILGNRRIKMRAYNELFTQVFMRINCIQDWLDLYASLRDTITVSDFPPRLQEEIALRYLRDLREEEVLDDNYQLRPGIRKSFASYIARNLSYHSNATYADCEKLFGVKNLRVQIDFNRLERKIKDGDANEVDEEAYYAINRCFSVK